MLTLLLFFEMLLKVKEGSSTFLKVPDDFYTFLIVLFRRAKKLADF